MMVKLSRGVRPPARRESVIEVFMPLGMRVFVSLYFVAGLSGLAVGLLGINQGFFEPFFDIQLLLLVQGGALMALGAAMFLVAVGMVSGAKWGIDSTKRVAGISVGWSAVGIPLAMYTAYNITEAAYAFLLYIVVGWLFAFGLAMGLIAWRYLYSQGATVRKYMEYVSTETLSRQKPLPSEEMLSRHTPSVTSRSRRRCLDCGSELREGVSVCPECGAPQGVV
jgi:hypothetical protein